MNHDLDSQKLKGNAMDLEDWEEDLLRRYPEGSTNTEGKEKEQFRDYEAEGKA